MNKEAIEARRKYYRDYKTNRKPEAREEYNRYNREWRARNRDKVRQYNIDYWEKKASIVKEPDIKQQVLRLKGQGRSLRYIGHELGISHMKAKRLLSV
jgi:hypothetical protein